MSQYICMTMTDNGSGRGVASSFSTKITSQSLLLRLRIILQPVSIVGDDLPVSKQRRTEHKRQLRELHVSAKDVFVPRMRTIAYATARRGEEEGKNRGQIRAET